MLKDVAWVIVSDTYRCFKRVGCSNCGLDDREMWLGIFVNGRKQGIVDGGDEKRVRWLGDGGRKKNLKTRQLSAPAWLLAAGTYAAAATDNRPIGA